MKNPRRAWLFAVAAGVLADAAFAGVPPTVPTITTTAAAAGASLSDTAHLSGGNAPTGTITFSLYGPNDATCSSIPSTEVVNVDGNGDYQSDFFTAPAAGTYRWTAAYSGDSGNVPVTTHCNDANESVTITPVAPTLTTTATPSGFVISDVAHLTGGNHPTGTIQFLLFGPDDATCGGLAIAPEPLFVDGNGDYPSGGITPPGLGTYRWTASYSGDAANDPAATSCNDANETSVATAEPSPAVPTLGPGALALLAALVAAAGAWKARA